MRKGLLVLRLLPLLRRCAHSVGSHFFDNISRSFQEMISIESGVVARSFRMGNIAT